MGFYGIPVQFPIDGAGGKEVMIGGLFTMKTGSDFFGVPRVSRSSGVTLTVMESPF